MFERIKIYNQENFDYEIVNIKFKSSMQEFYASIKLKNGDEMLTIVTETCPEEDYIKIKDPLGVEEIDIPGVIHGMKIKSWMKNFPPK